jgi:hypothetical protein
VVGLPDGLSVFAVRQNVDFESGEDRKKGCRSKKVRIEQGDSVGVIGKKMVAEVEVEDGARRLQFGGSQVEMF